MDLGIKNIHNSAVNNTQGTNSSSITNKNIENIINSTHTNKTTNKSIGKCLRNIFIAGIALHKKKNLAEVKKTFQKIFMNSKITLGEAYVMKKRYESIEKIKDKSEYIKALFEEAKNNFGFGKSNIKLETVKKEFMPDAIGGADNAFQSIKIREDIPRERILSTIHHEFRHHKQHYLAFNLSPENYMHAVNKKIEILTNGKVKDVWKDLDKFKTWIEASLNEKQSLKNIPEELIDYAKDCIKAISTYKDASKDFNAYANNFLETDARKAGAAIEKIMKLQVE